MAASRSAACAQEIRGALDKLERQKIDIEESLNELRRAIAVIDEAIAKGQLAAPQHQVAAE